MNSSLYSALALIRHSRAQAGPRGLGWLWPSKKKKTSYRLKKFYEILTYAPQEKKISQWPSGKISWFPVIESTSDPNLIQVLKCLFCLDALWVWFNHAYPQFQLGSTTHGRAANKICTIKVCFTQLFCFLFLLIMINRAFLLRIL